jgi:hypothetical protein
MHAPQEILDRWLCGFSPQMPGHVKSALAQLDRYEAAEHPQLLNWNHGELDALLHIIDQQRLEFSEEDSRANVRLEVAGFLDRVVSRGQADPTWRKLSQRLREARLTGTIMYSADKRKVVTIWDAKAGLPLLCPDDAREESSRVSRRYVPTLAEWKNNGKAVHKVVFTMPNYAPGQLAKGMKAIFKRFKRVVLGKRFPEVKGALCTLEAPLSANREWNVHLNVLLMCDGYLDYAKLRGLWHWQLDAYRVREGAEGIEATLRELVKYPVQAMPSKSHRTAAAGSYAPAMLEWTAAEFQEWWQGHQRFRRTRSYGLLFGLEKPPKEGLDGFVSVGTVTREGTSLIRRFALLDSIPGDKSLQTDHRQRLKSYLRHLLGDPHRHRAALQLLRQGAQAWQTLQPLAH